MFGWRKWQHVCIEMEGSICRYSAAQVVVINYLRLSIREPSAIQAMDVRHV
jgi:hypothetical protein